MVIQIHKKIDGKVDQQFFGWAWSKMGVANLVSGLNLNVSQE